MFVNKPKQIWVSLDHYLANLGSLKSPMAMDLFYRILNKNLKLRCLKLKITVTFDKSASCYLWLKGDFQATKIFKKVGKRLIHILIKNKDKFHYFFIIFYVINNFLLPKNIFKENHNICYIMFHCFYFECFWNFVKRIFPHCDNIGKIIDTYKLAFRSIERRISCRSCPRLFNGDMCPFLM